MNRRQFQEWLDLNEACPEGMVWAGGREPREAWDQCQRGDWLMWAARRLGTSRAKVLEAACWCARSAVTTPRNHEVMTGDQRGAASLTLAAAEEWLREPNNENWSKVAVMRQIMVTVGPPSQAGLDAWTACRLLAMAIVNGGWTGAMVDGAVNAAEAAVGGSLARVVRATIPWDPEWGA